MIGLSAKQVNQVYNLMKTANEYTGDNVYQDIFYQSNLVDIEATANAEPNIVVLINGDKWMYDEEDKEWC